MKAAVLREIKKPLSIEDVEVGRPGPREVLIRTHAAGICHSDLHFQTGAYFYPMPAVLGRNMGSNRFRTDMPKYVDFYLSGKLNLDDLLSRRLSLAEVNEGSQRSSAARSRAA